MTDSNVLVLIFCCCFVGCVVVMCEDVLVFIKISIRIAGDRTLS